MRARNEENARLVGGCFVGVMVWLFEHVFQLDIPLLSSFPYYFALWKGHVKSAEKAFNELDEQSLRYEPLDIRDEFVMSAEIGRQTVAETAMKDEEGLVCLATLATED